MRWSVSKKRDGLAYTPERRRRYKLYIFGGIIMTSLLAALFQPWQISCKTFQQLFTFVLELRV